MPAYSADLPDFLISYEDLNRYIRDDVVESLNNSDKGRAFAQFVSRIIPLSDLGDSFRKVELGPEGPDGGVDLTATSADNTAVLYGQSKLSISRATDIDTIISKSLRITSSGFTQIGSVRRICLK